MFATRPSTLYYIKFDTYNFWWTKMFCYVIGTISKNVTLNPILKLFENLRYWKWC